MADGPEGIDAASVTGWFEQHVSGVVPPLDFTLVAGGHSNLTFKVTDAAGHAYVLRRPPLGHVLATAHDMGREHKIISALSGTPVPVPEALGFVPDDSVNGAPFYVMDFVDGLILRTAEEVESQLPPDARRRAGESLIDTLAAIHAVEPASVGLGDLGRTEGYIARQLKRWQSQWEGAKTRELPDIDFVHDALASDIPEQGQAAIVHGDYRLDNCLMSPGGEVAAVLDWELCTLGDAMADLGLLHVYWADPEDGSPAAVHSATAADGFLRRADATERYAEASGRDVSNVDYYVAFGYWKLACISEGVYARYLHGAMGQKHRDLEGFAKQVADLAARARAAVERLG